MEGVQTRRHEGAPVDAGGCAVLIYPTDAIVWPQAAALATRLLRRRADVQVVLCRPEGCAPPPPSTLSIVDLPGAGNAAGMQRALITRTRPQVLIVIGSTLPAPLVAAAADGGATILLAQTGRPMVSDGWGWWPRRLAQLARRLERVFTLTDRDAAAWRRLVGAALQVEAVGALSASIGALPCDDSDREALASALRLRPAWMAVGVPEAEEEIIARAHAHALRLSHWLVLLLQPADPARGADLAARLGSRFAVALRSEAAPITAETQILIADQPGERGLWYRLATVCWMGGTLSGTGSSFDPLEPAALGAASVHGPAAGRFRASYAQLAQHGATQRISAPDTLGETVSTLLTPERAAGLATAGWAAASEGTESTDRVIAAALQVLDRLEAQG